MRGKGTQLAEMIICPIYANLPSELQAGAVLLPADVLAVRDALMLGLLEHAALG